MPFKITFLDIVDIFLVAILFYQLYQLIRGTPALSIFITIFFIYIFWLLVKALNLELMSTLLGQVIGVGVIALIIVFQQEIRRFLLITGNKYIYSRHLPGLKYLFERNSQKGSPHNIEEIVRAVDSLARKKTGALIVIGRTGTLEPWSEGGKKLNSQISSELLETIFSKNTPLHDGAVLIEHGQIIAARCPLPITEQTNISSDYGMRHRAALGISEKTDALVVVVSEETGQISLAESGFLKTNITPNELRKALSGEKV